jgi:type III secretion system YscQ/HrcQ family protein
LTASKISRQTLAVTAHPAEVRRIARGALPRVSAEQAAANLAAARLLDRWSAPIELEVEVARIGRVVVSYAGAAADDVDPEPSIAFGLARGALRGRVVIDAMLGRRLIASLLGTVEPLALRAASALERGLLAGVVAVVLGRLGVEGALSFAAPAAARGRARLALDLAACGVTGCLLVEIPIAWLEERARGPRWVARARRLPVVAAVELAATDLAAGALAALAVGDALVFDGVPAMKVDPSVGWPVSVVIGEYAAGAVIDGAGVVRIGDELRRVRTLPIPVRMIAAHPAKESPMSVPTPEDVTAVLAAAPVEVVAEIGRVVLRGDELLALAPGAVVPLPDGRLLTAVLRVGGEVWAEGELVDVDGALGVRVTALIGRGA